jgi:hypothetical protein
LLFKHAADEPTSKNASQIPTDDSAQPSLMVTQRSIVHAMGSAPVQILAEKRVGDCDQDETGENCECCWITANASFRTRKMAAPSRSGRRFGGFIFQGNHRIQLSKDT